jgi:hypothetical protein
LIHNSGGTIVIIAANFIPPFSIFSLAAILVGNRDHRTQFWNGAIQGPFHQRLVAIGPVVSEEKIYFKSTNQKQELPVTAMFVHGSELKVHIRCFILIKCSEQKARFKKSAIMS